MKRKLMLLLVVFGVLSSLVAIPAGAVPYGPNAFAKFTVDEWWYDLYDDRGGGLRHLVYNDRTEFAYNTDMISVTGNKFRIRHLDKSPTTYTTTLGYMTTSTDWLATRNLEYSTAVITPDGQLHDSYRDTNQLQFVRISLDQKYIILTTVTITGWADLIAPVSSIEAVPTKINGGTDAYLVTIKATDDLSGVNYTHVWFNNNNGFVYYGPFYVTKDRSPLKISYRSGDYSGNVEQLKVFELK
ncbi:hypothetical protein LJK87_19515 [Paenibacillus sp. P25]|nr:hypothetical protein LJK87_19515 [Paenibacillus sp. P25]